MCVCVCVLDCVLVLYSHKPGPDVFLWVGLGHAPRHISSDLLLWHVCMLEMLHCVTLPLTHRHTQTHTYPVIAASRKCVCVCVCVCVWSRVHADPSLYIFFLTVTFRLEREAACRALGHVCISPCVHSKICSESRKLKAI